MKIVFLGTPDFAVPSLNALINSKHEILAVVCQPDKKVGRAQQVVFSPVKELALKNGLKVLQYNKIRLEGVEELKNLTPDIMISCAYGQILSQDIIDIAPYGIINVHGSLLPKYRGASPVQQSVIDGEKETGITIMQTDIGIDSGDILAVKKTPIYENETAGQLFDRLSVIGAELLIDTLDKIEKGMITPIKQDDSLATHVKMIKKEDALIDWSKSATTIFNLVRGMNPWPVAFTKIADKMLKIYTSTVDNNSVYLDKKDGEVVCADLKNGLIIKCGEGLLKVEELQLEGSKRMSAHDFLLGRKISVGDILG